MHPRITPTTETQTAPAKVLHLTTQSATAFRFALPLAKYLRDKGYDVTIGCTDEPQSDVPDFHQDIEAAGFSLAIVPIPRRVNIVKDIRALREMVALLRREQFDIVHTHNSKAGFIGRVAAHLSMTPYIIHTDHGLPFFKRGVFSLPESLIFWALEFVAARLSHRILAVSDAEFNKVRKFFIAHEPKLVNVGQGVDVNFYSPEAAARSAVSHRVRGLKQKLRGKIVLGSAARLVPEKGIDCLIDAAAISMRACQDIQVVIMGTGSEQEKLARRAAALGIASSVHFLGFVNDFREVRQVYSLMDLFVLPTRWESFGAVFAEAMAMEIPVIGTRIEPITSVVADGETGLLVPLNDADAVASAIIELIDDPERRLKMGKAGRQRVIDLWDERSMFGRVEQVYRGLLSAQTAEPS